MLFFQFLFYLSFFIGIQKNKIQGATFELWQLKIEQSLASILKFSN